MSLEDSGLLNVIMVCSPVIYLIFYCHERKASEMKLQTLPSVLLTGITLPVLEAAGEATSVTKSQRARAAAPVQGQQQPLNNFLHHFFHIRQHPLKQHEAACSLSLAF